MRHQLFALFVVNFKTLGPSGSLGQSALGQRVIETMLSNDPVCAILGAIDAAPTRPPFPALDRYLLPVLGIRAADDDIKILVGRVLRQMVEHLGGVHVRKGVPITEASVFANGSIYRLPTTRHGRMNAADRRSWAELLLATISLRRDAA